MRLARLVAAPLLLGAVGGFVGVLTRDRNIAGQDVAAGAGADLPPRPLPSPIPPEPAGTGGFR